MVNEVINYQGGKNYAIRRIHPNLNNTEGEYLSTDIKDAAGNHPYQSELKGINAKGEIFQSYYFKNLDSNKIALKYSYAKLYKPFNWIIATGIPLENLYQVSNTVNSQNNVMTWTILFGVIIIIILLVSTGMLLIHKNNAARLVKEESLRTLYSSISHDMKTPMNAVIAYSSPELSGGLTKAELLDNMHKINISGQQLLMLINDILTASVIENNQRIIEIEPVRLYECIQPIYDIVMPRIKAKCQHFTINYYNVDSQLMIVADQKRLHQILINLINNASKYSDEDKEITCDVYGVKEDAKQIQIEIAVIDEGVGIPQSAQKKIFEPFIQLDASHSEGVGLGLSIVKSIVEEMGGKIKVASKPKFGTTFTIDLTFDKALNITDNNSVDTDSLSGLKILVAEDNDFNLDIITKLLTMSGVEVTGCKDGAVALATFNQNPPNTFDLILMDVHMPNLDGVAATKQIRALKREDAAKIAIIAMSADSLPQDIDQLLKIGMNDYVAKPINLKRLIEVINKHKSVT